MLAKTLFHSLLAAVLLQAAPTLAKPRVYAWATYDGGYVRLAEVPPKACDVTRPEPDLIVVTVRGFALPTRSEYPKAGVIRHVQSFGPEVLGDDLSRVVIELTHTTVHHWLGVREGNAIVMLEGASGRPTWRAARRLQQERKDAERALAEAQRAEEAAAEEAAWAAMAEVGRAPDSGGILPPAEQEVAEELHLELDRAADRLAHARRQLELRPPDVAPRPPAERTAPAPPVESMQAAPPPQAWTREPAPSRPATPPGPGPSEEVPPRMETSARPAAPDGMVLVPGGTFMMGSEDGFRDESPSHPVELNAFYIDRLEVTVGEFEQSRVRLPLQPSWNFDRSHPVVNVTWEEAASYCRSVGKRLPTEAEWEMAARGTDGRRFPWGAASDLAARTNSGMPGDGHEFAAPVGSFPQGASPHGALDMSGNVWEWVADWYGEDAYRLPSALRNPPGPARGSKRVARGGSFQGQGPPNVSTTVRYPLKGSARRDSVGFRCAR